jgi:dihydropteroate synthase
MQDIIFQAGKKALPLNKTRIMGILNCTPDSFSDGGKFNNTTAAVAHAEKMIADGADIIDIGGQSTRPGYTAISPEKEWRRIEDIVTALSKIDIILSVDTFYPFVARKAIETGVHIINDVTGFGKDMMKIAAESNCGCIIMYPHGAENGDIFNSARDFFSQKQMEANRLGISNQRLCMDPGIGFGKTYEENLQLIANVRKTKLTGTAYLMAASRKRVIGQPSGNPPFKERLSGTIAAHTHALMGGADILRVHDVKEAVQAARVSDALAVYKEENFG